MNIPNRDAQDIGLRLLKAIPHMQQHFIDNIDPGEDAPRGLVDQADAWNSRRENLHFNLTAQVVDGR